MAAKNWHSIAETEEVDAMAQILSKNVNDALDECAPVKSFKIRPAYIPGLQTETKSAMKQRDAARRDIKNTTGEKWILLLFNIIKILNKFKIFH